MSSLKISDLTAGYGGKSVIEQLTFSLEEPSLVGVLGANGSGKTTLLKAVCGILPHEGSCFLEGELLESMTPRKLAQTCSYIPQRSGISIDIPALDVVLMGFNPKLKLLEYPREEMKRTARKALEQVGLGGKEEVNYLHLSEGQKQLCILARTLVSDARLLLLDEPESALDFRFRYQMMEKIRSWLREGKRSALVALHDPGLAFNYCDQLLLLSEGKISGMLKPGTDSLEEMEEKLSQIYGEISLQRCVDRQGTEHLVMLPTVYRVERDTQEMEEP